MIRERGGEGENLPRYNNAPFRVSRSSVNLSIEFSTFKASHHNYTSHVSMHFENQIEVFTACSAGEGF